MKQKTTDLKKKIEQAMDELDAPDSPEDYRALADRVRAMYSKNPPSREKILRQYFKGSVEEAVEDALEIARYQLESTMRYYQELLIGALSKIESQEPEGKM